MNLRAFDLNLLVIFNAIWTHRNVTRAAESLNVSQSGVSAALGRLRRQFDDDLFIWNGRVMTPTLKATKLAAAIQDMLGQLEVTLAGDQDDPATAVREFVIATADYVVATAGAALVAELSRSAPQIVLDFVDLTPEMFNREQASTADLIIAPDLGLPGSFLNRQHLYDDHYVGLVSAAAGLPLEPDQETFLAAPTVAFSMKPYVVDNHETALLTHSAIRFTHKVITTHYMAMPHLIRASGLVGVIPERLARLFEPLDGLRQFAPPAPLPPIRMLMYWPDRLTRDRPHAWMREALLRVTA